MNANTVSRKLAEAGFARSSWSPVKGRGRSRRSNGFLVLTSGNSIVVSVKHYDAQVEANVHSFVVSLGLVEVERNGGSIRYEVAA